MSAVIKLREHIVTTTFGTVQGELPDRTVMVRTSAAPFVAKRAAGCLLEPRIGNRVLVVTNETGEAYVLTVLDRSDDEPATVSVQGDLRVVASTGNVSIAAGNQVEFTAAEQLTLTAPKLAVRTLEGTFFAESLNYLGKSVNVELDRIKTVARAVDSVLERVSQRVKRSFRNVEEVDQVRSGQIDYAASGNVQVRGENTVVVAEKLVKLNGEQIHLG